MRPQNPRDSGLFVCLLQLLRKQLSPPVERLAGVFFRSDMFDKSKAAQYFVVAWVKGWSLRTFLNAVSDGERIDWPDAHKHYPWLPHDEGPFVRNATVKRWTAEAMRSINDLLWDAADNHARLELSERIAQWNSAGARIKANSVLVKTRKEQMNLSRLNAADAMSKEQMRRGNGHHWSVCK